MTARHIRAALIWLDLTCICIYLSRFLSGEEVGMAMLGAITALTIAWMISKLT